MKYLLLTRHAHLNSKLGKYLGVGDIVDSEDPQTVKELLEMRGGHSYGQVGFGNVSGQGFPYFSPANFSLQQLAEALKAPEPEASNTKSEPTPEELEAAKKAAEAEEAKVKAEAEEAARKAAEEATEAAKKAAAEAEANSGKKGKKADSGQPAE